MLYIILQTDDDVNYHQIYFLINEIIIWLGTTKITRTYFEVKMFNVHFTSFFPLAFITSKLILVYLRLNKYCMASQELTRAVIHRNCDFTCTAAIASLPLSFIHHCYPRRNTLLPMPSFYDPIYGLHFETIWLSH